MIIHSRFKEYSVEIVNDFGFLEKIMLLENSEFVIDKNVYTLYHDLFANIPSDRLIIIEATEATKVIDTALNICEKMTDIPAKRNACLISIGGGIIQDITGFSANILYRGIKWVFIPTTLLAGCDSCIGGKTSLNYKRFKNLLGTFYPPDEIYICPKFFKTLTQKDFESGLGEVVKFNIMTGNDGLDYIENNIQQLLNREGKSLTQCIEKCLAFKQEFIETDEFDKGERIKLNFAHTFGHGLETITNYAIPHGTAVAIGMIMANHISENRGMISHNTVLRSENVLLQVIHIDHDLRTLDFDEYIRAIRKDKKQIGNQLTAVLMTNVPKDLRILHDIQQSEIRNAIDYFCDLYYR